MTDPASLKQQARTALASGRLQAAGNLLDGWLRAQPSDPEANILRGLAFVGEQRYAEALPHLQSAVSMCPTDGNAWMLLGGVLFATHERDAGITAMKRACELAPKFPAAWYNLGRSYKLLGRYTEAREALRQVLALDPGNVNSLLTLADVDVITGCVSDAVAGLRTLLRQAPGNARAWFALANLKVYRFEAADVATMKQAVGRADLSSDHRMLLDFALAKALDDIADYPAAWQALGAGNALARARSQWGRASHRADVDALMSAFAALDVPVDRGGRGERIVFVMALPRSGSTLVEQVLASHPDASGGNETNAMVELIKEESARRGSELAGWATTATAQDWQRLGEAYLERTAGLHQAGKYLIDKSLATWRLLGAARRMLPGARFINCYRDPLENCFSCYRQWFAQGCLFSYDFDDLASHYADYRRLLAFWRERFVADLFDLSYDAFVADPEPLVRAMLAFIGLPYDPACLTPERTQRAVTSSASAAQVRQPIKADPGAAARYGSLLDPLRIALARHGVC